MKGGRDIAGAIVDYNADMAGEFRIRVLKGDADNLLVDWSKCVIVKLARPRGPERIMHVIEAATMVGFISDNEPVALPDPI